jgi:Cft2 family RNA processing exonuclease
MEDVMTITPLGSGQEVGRSCHLLEFRGLTILLDCGIHPGYDGISGLPYFDRVNPEQVDVLLITHFHLDHAGETCTTSALCHSKVLTFLWLYSPFLFHSSTYRALC